MNEITTTAGEKPRATRRTRTLPNLSALLTAFALAAPVSPLPTPDPISLRVVNPFPPGAVPRVVRLKLLDREGNPLAAFERNVESVDGKDVVRDIPSASRAEKVWAEADLFDVTVTPLLVARESGIVLLPYGRATFSGLAGSSERPAPGAVRLWLRRRSDGKLVRATAVGAPGFPAAVSIPGGEWEAVLRAPGRAPVTASFSLAPGGDARVAVDRAVPGLSVSLVCVETETKKPVPQAALRWEPVPHPSIQEILAGPRSSGETLLAIAVDDDELRTDRAGRVRAEHLPPADHTWTVAADGFRTARHTVEPKPAEREKNVTIPMRPSPDIVVTVADLGGAPAKLSVEAASRAVGADTAIPLRPMWSGPVPPGTTTRFSRVREADYRFDLRDDAGILLTRAWVSPADKAWQQSVIPVKLVRAPRFVRGRVTRGDEPVAGLILYADVQTLGGPETEPLIPLSRFLERAARSGADGFYSLEIGGPGIYRIRYTSPPEEINGTAGMVDLTSVTTATLDFSLPPGRLAIDVVSAKDAKPLPGANLEITMWKADGRRGTSYSARSDESGRYERGGLDEERATVKATADGYETRIVEIPVRDPEKEPEPSKIELSPVAPLRFRISDSHRLPVPAAEVWSLEEPGPGDLEPLPRRIAVADATGLAVVENPPSEDRPYFFLARGYQLDLLLAAAREENPELPVALGTIQAAPALRLRYSNGEVPQIALAFRRYGVVYPWGLLGIKVKQEGRDFQATLVNGGDGAIPIHQLLAPGAYDVFAFAPADFKTRPRHIFREIGPLTLPLTAETTLTIPRGPNKGGIR
jgi:Carboxypeptidase regulatory-like domain